MSGPPDSDSEAIPVDAQVDLNTHRVQNGSAAAKIPLLIWSNLRYICYLLLILTQARCNLRRQYGTSISSRRFSIPSYIYYEPRTRAGLPIRSITKISIYTFTSNFWCTPLHGFPGFS